jgi:hypothetical protein
MARFKDFGSGTAAANTDPIVFKIHDEEFTCRAEIPGKTILSLVAKTSSENAGDSASVIVDFFNLVLVPESVDRFNALAEDPDRIVTIETLSEIVGWLVEQYTDRPTPRPEALPSGQ